MAETILGALIYFVYVVLVALSPALAAGTVLLARRRTVATALGTIVGIVAAILTLGATVALGLTTWQIAVVVFLAGQGALFGLGVVPLVVGHEIVRWATGIEREPALRVAVTAWPMALAGSFGCYHAPSLFAGDTLTSMSGIVAIGAWIVWLGLVLFGPGVTGAVGVQIWRRLS